MRRFKTVVETRWYREYESCKNSVAEAAREAEEHFVQLDGNANPKTKTGERFYRVTKVEDLIS